MRIISTFPFKLRGEGLNQIIKNCETVSVTGKDFLNLVLVSVGVSLTFPPFSSKLHYNVKGGLGQKGSDPKDPNLLSLTRNLIRFRVNHNML